MKTSKKVTVIIEEKDLQPLLDKAVKAVGGEKILNGSFNLKGGSRIIRDERGGFGAEVELTDPFSASMTLSVLVEKEIENPIST